ncbi:MAG: hypothetical protein Q7J12_03600 [Syntrophales bacterium]|nr:hypothetical protein [Syntrophales bacterium]
MKKNFSFALGSFFVLGMVLFWATSAQSAMTFKAGETGGISFGGYMENLSALRTGQEENGKIAGFRNVFMPEFLFTLNKEAQLFVSARIVKETGYDMEDSVRAAKGLPPLADNFYDETDFEPYELYLDVNLTKKLHLRTGKQFIIWGETDVFTLLDVISPSDSSWVPPAIMALEETRIPQYAARLTYGVTPSTTLEFVFVPMIDELDNRVNKSAPTGGRWAPFAENRPAAAAPKLYPGMMADFTKLGYNPPAGDKQTAPNVVRMVPDSDLNEARVGVRLTKTVGNATFTLVDFYGHNYSPVVQFDGVSKVKKRELVEVGGTPAVPGAPAYKDTNYFTPNFSVRYLRQNILGGSFSWFEDTFLKGIFRGEVAYYHNKPYNTYDPTVMDAVDRKDTISYVLGIDKQFYAPWLNPWEPNRVVFVSAQMFQDVILDHDNYVRFINTATPIDKLTTRFTLQVNTGFKNDTYVPSITVAYDPKGVGVVVPALIWNPPWSENYYVELKYANYWGDQYEYLGAFNEKDSVFLRLRYMW